jgi:hypothetical protein
MEVCLNKKFETDRITFSSLTSRNKSAMTVVTSISCFRAAAIIILQIKTDVEINVFTVCIEQVLAVLWWLLSFRLPTDGITSDQKTAPPHRSINRQTIRRRLSDRVL